MQGSRTNDPRSWRGRDPAQRTDDDDRYPSGTMQAADSRVDATRWDRDADGWHSERGYHYPGGARHFAESGARDGRDARRRAHFDEHESWDPDNRDELWRRGQYGSRLYGNVVGAATPSGTAGIGRYRAGGVERRGPKGYVRSDERLYDDICVRLSDEGWLELDEVEVQVSDGRVVLDGEVRNRASKYTIEDIADGVWGVKEVDNRLRVRTT